ncbi:MAG: carboxypeptidase-like regulatory domain-containing protein [Gammaproteobacteria bacterium]
MDRSYLPTSGWRLYVLLGAVAVSLIAAAILVGESGVLYPAVEEAGPLADEAQSGPLALDSTDDALHQAPEVTLPSPAKKVVAPTDADAVSGLSTTDEDLRGDAPAVASVGEPVQAFSAGEPNTPVGESVAVAAADLVIAGRILNPTGDPVAGIGVTARFTGQRQPATPASDYHGRSDAGGAYRIEGLPPGEYVLRTGPTDVYPSAHFVARAGLQSADIVLAEGRPITVFGTVTDTAGSPLAEVEVLPAHPAKAVRTDRNGGYAVPVIAQLNRGYVFRYALKGYDEERIVMPGKEFAGLAEKRVDVKLAAAGNTTDVAGAVHSEHGQGIAGVRVLLASSALNANYQVSTGEQGDFVIPGVEIGSGYQLSVASTGLHEAYSANAVDIVPNNPFMDITLQSFATGRVSGNIVDAAGNAVPDFTLLLRSSRAPHKPLNVVSDETGYFNVDAVPEGELVFLTRSNPHLQVRGVTLEADADAYVDIVLDWGGESIEGTVVNDAGEPVAGAEVSLSWSFAYDGVQSTSSRRSLADQTGLFRFSELGPGVHTLNISAPGFQRTRLAYDVGGEFGELVVRVTPQ